MTMTRYTMSIPTDEFNIGTGQPKRETWVRRCDTDAQAELWARRISEQHGGRRVRIQRGDATWSVDCGFKPTVAL
jgi:hypothetical protein